MGKITKENNIVNFLTLFKLSDFKKILLETYSSAKSKKEIYDY